MYVYMYASICVILGNTNLPDLICCDELLAMDMYVHHDVTVQDWHLNLKLLLGCSSPPSMHPDSLEKNTSVQWRL